MIHATLHQDDRSPRYANYKSESDNGHRPTRANIHTVLQEGEVQQLRQIIHFKLQSWTKLLGQICTCHSLHTRDTKNRMRFKIHEPSPSPLPTYNVEKIYPPFFLSFNIVLGVGGGNCNGVLRYSSASLSIWSNHRLFRVLHDCPKVFCP